MDPVHPGEILKHDFMEPFALSATALANAIGVDSTHIDDIVDLRRGITAETALRLARYFNTDAQSWMNLRRTGAPTLRDSPLARSSVFRFSDHRHALAHSIICINHMQIANTG